MRQSCPCLGMPHSPWILLGRQNFKNLECFPVSFSKQNASHQHPRCQHNPPAAAISLLSSVRENLLDAKPPEAQSCHPHTQLDLDSSFCHFPPEGSEESKGLLHSLQEDQRTTGEVEVWVSELRTTYIKMPLLGRIKEIN